MVGPALIGQVNARYPAAKLVGEAACGPAEATADVEHMHVRPGTYHTRKLESGLAAPNVKLVNRREVLRFEVLDVFPCMPRPRELKLLDRASRSVA